MQQAHVHKIVTFLSSSSSSFSSCSRRRTRNKMLISKPTSCCWCMAPCSTPANSLHVGTSAMLET